MTLTLTRETFNDNVLAAASWICRTLVLAVATPAIGFAAIWAALCLVIPFEQVPAELRTVGSIDDVVAAAAALTMMVFWVVVGVRLITASWVQSIANDAIDFLRTCFEARFPNAPMSFDALFSAALFACLLSFLAFHEVTKKPCAPVLLDNGQRLVCKGH